ncbi:S-adenosyl-L-methionine-dependent methyltransferase [Mycena floridula]|nr:S-adenosyl-L-methionine-dependent methyltransferase [Mycena floridula]
MLAARSWRTVWHPLNLRSSSSQIRFYATDPHRIPKDRWNYNSSSLFDPSTKDISTFRYVTANELESGTEPPRSVKMLVRDYIEDALYNPNYGYFSKQVAIFDTKEDPFDFPAIKDSAEFSRQVARKYAEYAHNIQLWHTPTELFRPWYGQAIARCLVSEYLLKYFPYEDFIIYEIGAGNGTLAMDILNFIQREHPEVYDRTRYVIVEISEGLAKVQRKKLLKAHPCVEVNNVSIFHWNVRQPAPCFFVALEVIDNFAHDVIRYDIDTLQPFQGLVTVDDEGDFDMYYSPITDPLIAQFMALRKQLGHPPPISKLFQKSKQLRKIYSSLPFAANMTKEEYIPTRLLSLLRTLRNHFPRHRLLLSDFSFLPDTIPGANAPVVQTRHRHQTIPCSNLLVKQGAFDIFFPTNFERLRDMYEHTLSRPHESSAVPSRSTPLTPYGLSLSLGPDFFSAHKSNRRSPQDGVSSASGLPIGERKSSVFTHAEFLQTYAELGQTRLKNGENPMLDFYKNVKFLF